MSNLTDRELFETCFSYMDQVYDKGMKTQQEIIIAASKIRGFVDAAQKFQGMSDESADTMKRQIMAFALLHEERLRLKPFFVESILSDQLPS